MKVLVGLGNPGDEYSATRHNVGFMVVDELLRRHRGGGGRTEQGSPGSTIRLAGQDFYVAKPQGFMNRSGRGVLRAMERAGAVAGDLLVICDDLYLDLGTVRLRRHGSHGGHNGLRSILETLGTELFARLRVGIGPVDPGVDHAEFVLSPFLRGERAALETGIVLAADCIEMVVDEGIDRAMARFNRRGTGGPPDEPGEL